MDSAQRLASNAIREQEGLLRPEEIKSIRDRLSISQADFERLLGVGEKTVVRWERGTVFQNAATDNLMRVVSAFPQVAHFLAERHGVTIEAPDSVQMFELSFGHPSPADWIQGAFGGEDMAEAFGNLSFIRLSGRTLADADAPRGAPDWVVSGSVRRAV